MKAWEQISTGEMVQLKLVLSPDLIRHVYRFQYNAHAQYWKRSMLGLVLGLGPRLSWSYRCMGPMNKLSGAIYSVTLSLVYLVSKIVELVFPFLHTCRSIHLWLKIRKKKESKSNVTKLTPQMAPKINALHILLLEGKHVIERQLYSG